MPEVSVVIVARNAGRTIEAALASVFGQTYLPDTEIIVVDNGSTDDTAFVVQRDPLRATLVPLEAADTATAWNAGLARARGRVIMLLDPRDFWMPRKIQRQLHYFDTYPEAALLYGDALRSHSPAAALLDSADALPITAAASLEAPTHAAAPPRIPALSTIAIRREALEATGAPAATGASSDVVQHLWSRLAGRFAVGCQPVPLVVVRAPAAPRTSGPTERRARNLLHDTTYRRARSAVTAAFHAVDSALSRPRMPLRILFEAASPMSLAVFQPVLRRMERDPRLQFWFTSCDRSWNPDAIFGAAGISERVVSPDSVRWGKFDAYVNTDFWDMTWLPRRTNRVHLFHGVAGKYGLDAPVKIAPVVATFDRLMFPNRDRLRRYADAGLIDPESPQAALIGYPKVDCLVDGSLDRDATLARLGLDRRRPTILYAPTWSPYSSLNAAGDDIVAALGSLGVNVIVKLHDRSYDATRRGSGGVDWRQRLSDLCERHGAHLVQDADASPWLHAADLLVTDHSSVGFEFMLLDRPVVVIHSPDLLTHARVNPQKAALLRRASFVVEHRSAIASTVRDALDRPLEHGSIRRDIADELFYCPGTATARAVQCLYDLIALPQPTTADAASPARDVAPLATLARSL
jgi:glycosyltransferase involved in cell wall biosynthesis